MAKTFPPLKQFEYDLWIHTDGRCFARVKATGDSCEIDRTTLRYLRSLEKKLRREFEEAQTLKPKNEEVDEQTSTDNSSAKNNESSSNENTTSNKKKDKKQIPPQILSISDNERATCGKSLWLEDCANPEDLIITQIMEKEFKKTLSKKQLELYIACMENGVSAAAYAKTHKVSPSFVSKYISQIREKAKKFFKS